MIAQSDRGEYPHKEARKMKYVVGVTRKTNTKIGSWVGEDGYVYSQAKAKEFETYEEAKKVAAGETDGKYRGVVWWRGPLPCRR